MGGQGAYNRERRTPYPIPQTLSVGKTKNSNPAAEAFKGLSREILTACMQRVQGCRTRGVVATRREDFGWCMAPTPWQGAQKGPCKALRPPDLCGPICSQPLEEKVRGP